MKAPSYKYYHNAMSRCHNVDDVNYKRYGGKGIKMLLSKEDILLLWNRDEAYLMRKPTIDRLDSLGNYTMNNCRFLEHKVNAMLGALKTIRAVRQYTLDGDFIKEYPSLSDAARKTNIDVRNICDCALGKNKTSHGFIWRYKNGKS